jgi:hypothetical protein
MRLPNMLLLHLVIHTVLHSHPQYFVEMCLPFITYCLASVVSTITFLQVLNHNIHCVVALIL